MKRFHFHLCLIPFPRIISLIYILLLTFSVPVNAQNKSNTPEYKALILQADKAYAAKDYPAALLAYERASRSINDQNYASSKITEINKLLDGSPTLRADLIENLIIKAEELYKAKNYSSAKIEYQEALILDPTAQFPKDRLSQISAVYSDPGDDEYFADAMSTGDKALSAEEYDKAIQLYESALAVKPDSKTAKDKLASARKTKEEALVSSGQAAKILVIADKLLQSAKRDEARTEYQKVLALSPKNAYAKQKIQEIDNYLNAEKELQDRYNRSIELADQFYINRDFVNARQKYLEALTAKPQARYPKEMLEKTKSGETQLQSDEQNYAAALSNAENLLKSADYQGALLGFKSALALKPAENYPKTKIAETEKLINERTSRKEAFDIAIKNGDQAFNENKYDPALTYYRNALTLLPDEKYPTQKIGEITALIGQQKLLDQNYSNAITEGDKQFNDNKFEEALSFYSKALSYKPNEIYPAQKSTEAQNLLAAAKNKATSYSAAIRKGDSLLTNLNYNAALDAYKQALTFKPAENYPKAKSDEINTILSRQKTEADTYARALDNGDRAFSQGNYSQALTAYQEALTAKPADPSVLAKIAEVKAAIAATDKKNEKYTTALNTGNQLFENREYDRAMVAYKEAAILKSNEKYPAEQIEKINKIYADLQLADENYAKAIAAADRSFNKQLYSEASVSYQQALLLKPSETYPQTKLDQINTILGEQKKANDEYLGLIASADAFFNASKYEEAQAEYHKSLLLKPSEKYPSEKIAEADKLIAGLKALQLSYEKAIAEGDKFLFAKEYTVALASFKSAGQLKPDETYPKQKISEIQTILDKDKAEGQRYQETIILADKLFVDQKYSEAIEVYHQANTIKPAEKYPLVQVGKIILLQAEQKKLDEDYTKVITAAASALLAGKYEAARNLYSNASTLKPSEKLPKDKIAEIDGLLADIQTKEQNFSKAINNGNAAFTDKKYDEALAAYAAATALKPAENYPKLQIEKINLLLAEQKKLDNNYLSFITVADQLFDSKKYQEAIGGYRKALELKSSEKYPLDKIMEAQKLVSEIKALQLAYEKAVAEADKKLAEKDYENALASYTSAATLKPAETYPAQKITEIQAVLNMQKAENKSYQEALALADRFFSDQKFREALEPYQSASTIKPVEKYPVEQIARINKLLAEQKKLDDSYQKMVLDAEGLMKEGKYTEARILFVDAGKLKPSEKLPAEKIAELDNILAGLKLNDENYTKALQTAADFYSAKNLQAALKSYQEAQGFKPAEKYPQDRITAIKGEIKAIDDRYSAAVALGDSKLAAESLMEALNAFQNALEIKPAEEYPKTKIAGINAALVAQKEKQEQIYTSYLADGDRLYESKEYSEAKSAYTKANGIKPNESYPKQRILEITKIMEDIELARRAEYNKALGEADKLYNTRIFDQAIEAYDVASRINPGDPYPGQQISKIRKYMADHAIQDLFSQTLLVSEGMEKKFTFSPIEPRQRKNNYILLKARSTGKTAPKVYLNYGRDNQKNGGIVLRSLDKKEISDFLIRISVQDKWYREDNNWISLFIETGEIEISKVQIAAGEE